MKASTLAILLAVLMTACQPPGGTLFRATVLQPDDSYPIPVVLGDQTGLVIAIESAPGDSAIGDLPLVKPDPDDPNAVIVSWGTGACDDDVAVSFERSGARYRLAMEVHDGFSLGGCTAQLLIRGLRIEFSTAIPADSIAASVGR